MGKDESNFDITVICNLACFGDGDNRNVLAQEAEPENVLDEARPGSVTKTTEAMTTNQMEFAISRRFDVRTHLMVPNVSWGLFSHEADVLVVRQTGYCLEFEIKRTFADYKADFKKHKWNFGLSKLIKEFYYTFPAELWHKREGDIRKILPDFAGVLVIYNGVTPGSPTSKIVRDAKPNNRAVPLNKSQMYDVARLGTMRIWNMKRQIITLKNRK